MKKIKLVPTKAKLPKNVTILKGIKENEVKPPKFRKK